MITLRVNNKLHKFPKPIILEEVLEQLGISQTGIAVAVNQNIIAQSDWKNLSLLNNDNVLIVKATQGG